MSMTAEVSALEAQSALEDDTYNTQAEADDRSSPSGEAGPTTGRTRSGDGNRTADDGSDPSSAPVPTTPDPETPNETGPGGTTVDPESGSDVIPTDEQTDGAVRVRTRPP